MDDDGDCPGHDPLTMDTNQMENGGADSAPSLIAPSTQWRKWHGRDLRLNRRSSLRFHSGAVLMGFVFPRLTFANDVYNPPLATLSSAENIHGSQPRRVWVRVLRRSATFAAAIVARGLTRTLRKTTGMESATRRSDKLVSIHSFPSSSPFFFSFFLSLFLLFQPSQWVAHLFETRRDERGEEEVWSGDSQWELSFITGPRGHNETKLRYNEGPDLLYIYMYISAAHVVVVMVVMVMVVGFAPEEHVFPSSSRPKGIITLRRGATVWWWGEWKGWKEEKRWRQGRRVSIMAP